MDRNITLRRARSLFLVAIAMTWGAEIVYLIGWGVILFPGGSLFAKTVWTTVCGIGMGAVVGTILLLFVEGRLEGDRAFWWGAAVPFAIGGSCAVLCGRIDATFNYFGGADSPLQFVLSGVIPAALGGLLYGWLLYRKSGQVILARVL